METNKKVLVNATLRRTGRHPWGVENEKLKQHSDSLEKSIKQ